MQITPSKVINLTKQRLRDTTLRVVYLFSPSRYWDMRSRDIHNRYYENDSDYSIIKDVLLRTKAHNCLEIGCGSGRYSRLLAADLNSLHCQDISDTALKMCKENIAENLHSRVRFEHGFLPELYSSLEDRHFDITFSNRVLGCLQPGELEPNLDLLSRISKNILINELLPGEPGATFYWFAYDYDALFAARGMTRVLEVVSHSSPFVQKYRLYSHSS